MFHRGRGRALWCAVVVAAVAASPAAEARVDAPRATAHTAAAPAHLRLTQIGLPSSTVRAGRRITVVARVMNPRGRRTTAGRLTVSLRSAQRARRGRHLYGTDIARTRAGEGWRVSMQIVIPRSVGAGRRWLHVCVRSRGASARASCRARRITVRPALGAPLSESSSSSSEELDRADTRPDKGTGGPGGSHGGGGGGDGALHSLRAPLTGENFYFVMADRFENGRTDNDHGGLPPGRMTSGFDPTARGFYHGGDLKGLLDRIDYIQDLGTTAIWLTPSFKNKAVQPEDNSAGYHGYWITDFTQIDPHLGTNAELRALVDAAHARGMKVFFDIITNHTADVIAYEGGNRRAYVSKDERPYRTAAGAEFDDRDYAGTGSFPALSAATSFPYVPFNQPGAQNVKTPDWLNDVTLYHNRGDTTFVGENSFYGDFFGLDDLFTEHPRVVDGMIDIYTAWIRDFGVDGFRIDTMKHVDDEFWQAFAPQVLAFARAHGKRDFLMFGEVFDLSRPFTSRYTTHNRVQSVLDFPFQGAAQAFAASSSPTDALRDFFVGDDWYTDADSNAYQLPTFLGNHDMGRIGMFIRNANPGAGDPEVFARDRLAHELMYLSRGMPVIYYGDEQGFVGDGGDQLARQDMFPSQVAEYNDDDLIGTDATTAESNFDRSHVLYRAIARLADVTRDHPALRNGAQQHRLSGDAAGIYALSRLDRTEQREYVVALNNSETEKTALIPTYAANAGFTRIYAPGARHRTTDGAGRLQVTVPPLSTQVYLADRRMPRSASAPSISISAPAANAEGRERVEVGAAVDGSSFYEVTFHARVGHGDWHPIGTDDNAPYRVFHDIADLDPGTKLQYKAVVLDNAGHTRTSAVRKARVAPPAIEFEAPPEGAVRRGRTEFRTVAVPEHPHYVVTFQRRVGTGAWTTVDSDDSSPVYTLFDDVSALGQPEGTEIRYRAILDYGAGTVTSDVRTVRVAGPPLTTAVVHYRRPAGDYADWGLHLWGDAIAPGVATDWNAPRQRDGVDSYGAFFNIPLQDDTKPVNFILHRPGGDSVPTTREPGGDRSFVPIEHPHIWLRAGDPAIHFSEPAP